MSACVLSYNKVTSEVTITAEAAELFGVLVKEQRDALLVKIEQIREYRIDHPANMLVKAALDINTMTANKLHSFLKELNEVTENEKAKEDEDRVAREIRATEDVRHTR